ncbi:MAG: site-specific DNA-methyltransferase [Gemmatimonadota bacterium]|nr:site-specific DNA-methyltransferase [Gemmatimonadota bacterium]
MERIVAGNPETHSRDIVAENLQRLQVLFPEAVAEGQVDFDVLRQLLGDVVAAPDEMYGLNWHGKRRARHLALTPSTGTLRPCSEESVDWDTTQHVIIEGDNLEVLKLLQKSYSRQIKTIYIDPPYNTGNNLIYPNDYSDGVRAYLDITGQSTGSTRLTTNPMTGGRFHANWLSMIYPRLVLARNLLSPNGVLICTIDDNEVNQLGLILREVFEEGNFDHVCVPIVHNPRGIQGKNFSYVHEYAFFVYRRGTKAIADRLIPEEDVSWSQFRNWGTESERQDAKNCFYPVFVKDGLISGFGQVCDDGFHPHQTEIHDGVAYVYPIDGSGIERKWRYARQSVEAIQNLLRARKTKRGYEIEIGKNFGLYKTVWSDKRYDANEYGTRMVGDLVPDSPFTFPKSLWAVYDIILAATGDEPNGIVMDFFAGSGTTGHAVIQQNADYNRASRYIMVQLPEPIAGSDAFSTIADLTKARMKAASKKLADENPLFAGDVGFRVFKLDTSNIRAWDPAPVDLDDALLAGLDHIEPGRSEQDILYELILKLGLDLCIPIESRTIAGKSVHSVGGGVLIACLDEAVAGHDVEQLASGICDWHEALAPDDESTVVFRDSAFADDVAKTNLAAILEQRGLGNIRSL